MTGEEMERAIEFLINHHAKVSSDIEGLKEAQNKIGAHIASLAQQAEVDRREMRETLQFVTDGTRESFQMLTDEMREGFNKLILSNEVTRDLANQVARLAIATSQRVTVLEERVQ